VSEHGNANDLGAVLPGDPRERRRMIIRSAIRILAMTGGLLVLYALVPIPGPSGIGALVGMALGLIGFLGLIGWQIRTIVRAEHPVLRAFEVVAFAVPLLVVVFAFTYLSLSRAEAPSFTEHLDRVGALYYTVSTLSTVGFGDIAARSDAARILVTVQMLFDLALIGGLVRLIVLVTRAGLRRQSVSQEVRGDEG
jgi:voltage-gated potassium channel